MEDNEDIVFEDSNDEGEAISGAQKVKQLRDKIKELEKEKQEYLDGWQRARADYSNLLKTQEDEKKRLRGVLEENFIEELIPVVDSFNGAFNNKEAWEAVDPNWRKGIEYIYQQLMNTLETHSLRAFGEIGDTFDPSQHQAVSEKPTDDETLDHTVAAVLQKGFMLGSNVLRPARVSVYTLQA
jgi:molecular chaperone GrpE